LRYAASGQLQQCWTRVRVEWKSPDGGGRERRYQYDDEEWRDIPREAISIEEDAACVQG
jgi:hypothetical protein